MKRSIFRSAFCALALCMGLCTLAPSLHAQSQKQNPNQSQTQSEQKTATFTGQIIKIQNGQFALLTDKQQNKGFFLDNQEKAKQFEGQNVKVIGVLEASTGTIHVTDIQPA